MSVKDCLFPLNNISVFNKTSLSIKDPLGLSFNKTSNTLYPAAYISSGSLRFFCSPNPSRNNSL
jgi:hypothetical protein